MNPDCLPGQPSTELNPCNPLNLSVVDIIGVDSFLPVITGLFLVFAAVAGVFIVIRGGNTVLSAISPKHDPEPKESFTYEEAINDPNSFQSWKANDGSFREYDIDEDGVIRDIQD